ncbi:TAT-variant-translocated molybdopterin oxidoreductase [Paracrocinitomix mangrovi]|uniref:TAT-variant-translocated molybdopterin oxidoreductase n=1 Tax=Paracrocinitomix mangrovi TaxID=2862509 RepID=UPI001C8E5FA0|nr:TAT-variant-translocated molybdopterin oxidoreductase [Paracrocinitomix mangrovi]UKN00870.1 TAT-variant-translocated molybdopterin oxidoreductase [Paracrocinitomix mangrovi]
MGTNKKYWKGFDELEQTPEFIENAQSEFPQELSVEEFLSDSNVNEASTGRRDFLKFLGFSVAAATLAACEAPVIKAVPYAVKPEDVTPGVANWYASTYYDGSNYASILVKSREGRPIHIKGNKDFGFTGGAISPQIAASVLSLYNGARLTSPTIDGAAKSWSDVDGEITAALNKVANGGKKIVLLSGTEISPSTLDIIERFKAKYGGYEYVAAPVPNPMEMQAQNPTADVLPVEGEMPEATEGKVTHVQYDAVSYNGIREANKESFGQRIIPDYDFSKAKVIVSVACDFLNSWVLPTQFTSQYALRRNPDGEWMSQHYQFESNMSQTGSNADYRGMIKPSQQGAALAYLHKAVVGTAVSGADTASLDEDTIAKLDLAAEALKNAKGESLVVAGSNRKSIQVVVNSINNALNNYKSTINLNNPIELHKSEDAKMAQLVKDMGAGKVGAIVMWNTNPVYTMGESFKTALEGVENSIAISQYADETAALCKYVAAESHALESWNDYNPKMTEYALAQPTIRPLHDTRCAAESLMIWAGEATHVGKDTTNYHDHIKWTWEKYGFPMQTKHATFYDYWNAMVHQSTEPSGIPANASAWPFNGNLSAAGKDIAGIQAGDMEVAMYQKAAIGVGTQAANPWLQEMPDTVTKVTWDNYATVSYEDCDKLGLEKGLGQETPSSVITVNVGDTTLTLPAYPQPGQAPGTIGIALGYGRGEGGEEIGKAAFQQVGDYGQASKNVIGVNAFKLVSDGDYDVYNASISKTDEEYNLACTQTHSTVMARNSIVKETTLGIYKTKGKGAYNHQHTLHMGWDHEEKPVTEFDLWPEHPVEKVGHRWGMTIDLSSCIGCGSCLIACQSENNVPVVGKDEVRRGREMHWLRLDRYYASDAEATVGTRNPDDFAEGGFGALKKPANNPKVVHMPMMCHHCNHAPCETVCPVAATTHSNEGLNQMAYNRCIGTRYCGNNCPYKVRRFNWFNYPSYRKFTEVNPSQDDLGRMVLNPDVVVRTRGVMEKCSMCVQRIQSGKLVAKKEDRMVKDGDVTTACADVCPTNAIIMGDWNDVNSGVRKSSEEDRSYQALEEIGVKPNIWYKVKVRNEHNEELDALQVEHHGGHESHGDEHAEEGHDSVDTGHENGAEDHGH